MQLLLFVILIISGASLKISLTFPAVVSCLVALVVSILAEYIIDENPRENFILISYFTIIGAVSLEVVNILRSLIVKYSFEDVFTLIVYLIAIAIVISFKIDELYSAKETKRLNILSSLPLGIGLILGGFIGFYQKKF